MWTSVLTKHLDYVWVYSQIGLVYTFPRIKSGVQHYPGGGGGLKLFQGGGGGSKFVSGESIC